LARKTTRPLDSGRLGQIRDRAYESQLHRARGLNLLVAAIVL
jgi:TnpA family transposase